MPAIVSEDTFARVAARLADNKRFASRNSKNPSLLQGMAACAGCGYGYYRTSTRTTNKKIYYYRCLGSDDYRYETGRVCGNKPVRADFLAAGARGIRFEKPDVREALREAFAHDAERYRIMRTRQDS